MMFWNHTACGFGFRVKASSGINELVFFFLLQDPTAEETPEAGQEETHGPW